MYLHINYMYLHIVVRSGGSDGEERGDGGPKHAISAVGHWLETPVLRVYSPCVVVSVCGLLNSSLFIWVYLLRVVGTHSAATVSRRCR